MNIFVFLTRTYFQMLLLGAKLLIQTFHIITNQEWRILCALIHKGYETSNHFNLLYKTDYILFSSASMWSAYKIIPTI
jgi:hypothetical protein